MSNILSGVDRLCNLLTSYLQLSPSLPICPSPPSSSSIYLTKANRKRANSPDPIVRVPDSKIPTETIRRNTLVALGAKRLNKSRKAREIKCLLLPSPLMKLSLDLLPLSNSQTVYNSQTPLWIFWRTLGSLCRLLQHLPSDLSSLRKPLAPSCSLSGWVLRSHLRLSGSWIQFLQRFPRPILISIPYTTTSLYPPFNPQSRILNWT